MQTTPSFDDQLREAIGHYWTCLDDKATKQSAGTSTARSRRLAAMAGKRVDGFSKLVNELLTENGLAGASVHTREKRDLPGFFRATKDWDVLVIHEQHPVAALQIKSQRGPSFRDSFSSRTEEALGNADDLWAAYRKGAFGSDRPRPWLGWVMLLEDCPQSTQPVAVAEPHIPVSPEFQATSYAKRYEFLLRKLLLERLYDDAALLMATETQGRRGQYTEPASDLSVRKLFIGLAGHVATYAAGI